MYRYFIQPQLNKVTNSLIGYELLLKYHEPEGWRPPENFAKVPASTIANTLVLSTAKLAIKVGSVSVNLNRNQMMNPFIIDALIKSQDQLRPMKLNIELTEEEDGSKISNAELFPILGKFLERGMELCLDDVGTGENQLNEIEAFLPYVTELKFALQNFEAPFSDPAIQAKVTQWHELAQKYKLRFILEGIEDADDDAIADQLKIDLRQGYFYGKPHLVKLAVNDPIK